MSGVGGAGGGTWLPPRRQGGVALRLLAFPYSGGDTSIFAPWAEELPRDIELLPVQLPGRGRRAAEPAFDDLGPLLAALVGGLAPVLTAGEPPFALFGHSMGGIVAFELARELRRRGLPLPQHLCVSGRPAPQLPRRYGPLSHLPDAQFLGALYERYGYAAPDGDPALDELRALMRPTIRRDVMVSDGYAYTAEPPLPCPITAFGGLSDATVTRAELAAWQHQTSARFETRMLPGGHFYLDAEPTFLVRFLVQSLRSAAAPPA